MPTSTARNTAQRLLARELGSELVRSEGNEEDDSARAGDVIAAGARLLSRVTEDLARSFGPYGTHTLVSRALTRAQLRHPVLSTARLAPVAANGSARGVDRPTPIVDLEAVSATGSAAGAAGVTAWLAQIADLLGELVGDDLAVLLLEQSATARPRRPAMRSAVVLSSDIGDGTTVPGTHLDVSLTVDDP